MLLREAEEPVSCWSPAFSRRSFPSGGLQVFLPLVARVCVPAAEKMLVLSEMLLEVVFLPLFSCPPNGRGEPRHRTVIEVCLTPRATIHPRYDPVCQPTCLDEAMSRWHRLPTTFEREVEYSKEAWDEISLRNRGAEYSMATPMHIFPEAALSAASRALERSADDDSHRRKIRALAVQAAHFRYPSRRGRAPAEAATESYGGQVSDELGVPCLRVAVLSPV